MSDKTYTIMAVIEPPDDHPGKHLVSGERIPVVITMPGHFPWHEPWVGWKIADVVVEDEKEESQKADQQRYKIGLLDGRYVLKIDQCIHHVALTDYCDICREGM